MTVKELINKLKEYPQDKKIEIYCSYDCGHAVAGGDQIEIEESEECVELLNNEC